MPSKVALSPKSAFVKLRLVASVDGRDRVRLDAAQAIWTHESFKWNPFGLYDIHGCGSPPYSLRASCRANARPAQGLSPRGSKPRLRAAASPNKHSTASRLPPARKNGAIASRV